MKGLGLWMSTNEWATEEVLLLLWFSPLGRQNGGDGGISWKEFSEVCDDRLWFSSALAKVEMAIEKGIRMESMILI